MNQWFFFLKLVHLGPGREGVGGLPSNSKIENLAYKIREMEQEKLQLWNIPHRYLYCWTYFLNKPIKNISSFSLKGSPVNKAFVNGECSNWFSFTKSKLFRYALNESIYILLDIQNIDPQLWAEPIVQSSFKKLKKKKNKRKTIIVIKLGRIRYSSDYRHMI